jgi:two-component system cell cycle sensor histidine kinase/response regulator CckA
MALALLLMCWDPAATAAQQTGSTQRAGQGFDDVQGAVRSVPIDPLLAAEHPNPDKLNHRKPPPSGIGLEELPIDSITVEGSHSLYDRHKSLIWGVLLAIIALHFIIFSLILNILRRKRAEKELRRSAATLRATFQSTGDGLLVMSADGRISQINERFREIWRVPDKLARSGRYQELIDHMLGQLADPSELVADFQRASSRAGKALATTQTKDGRSIEYFSSPFILGGQHAGSVWSFRDISAKIKMESQLLQAQKMEAIGNLAGGIAHDFNNRLQTISGYTQLLMMNVPEKSSDGLKLRAIENAVRRSSQLIEQLLMFSRKIESRLQPCDLNHQVRKVNSLLERTIPRVVTIDLDLQENLEVVNADPAQIEQVIMNLGINAAQAMPEGGTMTIETRNVILDETYCRQRVGLDAGKYARLRITDTGWGMNESLMAHIFEPFFTTKPPGKGTGLGLAMVHGIVINHGGHISCYSEPGHGACFEIHIPTLEIEREITEAATQPRVHLPGGQEAVLLVDDETDNLEIGRSILQRVGYQVVSAENGQRAIDIFKRKKNYFDLVIMDLDMPHMNGREALETLLKINPQTKVLVASGYGADATVLGALHAGATDFIAKPYALSSLLQKVRQVLDGDAGHRG